MPVQNIPLDAIHNNPYQMPLIQQNNAWMHYIGYGYYADEKKFLREAKRSGISRRVPAQTARGMEFGDRLVFLRYVRAGSVFAFAEGRIYAITLDQEIAQEVGERLIEEGRAEYHEGGGAVERECGTYLVIGTFTVTASLKEIINTAAAIHARKNGDTPMFVMVNARLIEVYQEPVFLQPAPKFTRGFIRSEFSYEPPTKAGGDVIAISGYARKERPRRKQAAAPMLPAMV